MANQKCDNAEYDDDDDDAATDADGHMIPMCWLCDSKSRYVYLTKEQRIYTQGLRHYKEWSIVIISC